MEISSIRAFILMNLAERARMYLILQIFSQSSKWVWMASQSWLRYLSVISTFLTCVNRAETPISVGCIPTDPLIVTDVRKSLNKKWHCVNSSIICFLCRVASEKSCSISNIACSKGERSKIVVGVVTSISCNILNASDKVIVLFLVSGNNISNRTKSSTAAT